MSGLRQVAIAKVLTPDEARALASMLRWAAGPDPEDVVENAEDTENFEA